MGSVKAYSGSDPYIFVSYSHRDQKRAERFIAALQKNYNVWFDEGIQVGPSWEDEITKRIGGCSLFLFLLTRESLQSEPCRGELFLAKQKKKNIVNIMVENTEHPDWFIMNYGWKQMLFLYDFSSDDDAIAELEVKCEWLKPLKKRKTAQIQQKTPESVINDQNSIFLNANGDNAAGPKAYDVSNPYVAVIYSKNDEARAARFIAALQKKYPVWYYDGLHYSLGQGSHLSERLSNCSLAIFLATGNSVGSDACRESLRYLRTIQKNLVIALPQSYIELPDEFNKAYSMYTTWRLDSFTSDDDAIAFFEGRGELFAPFRKQKAAPTVMQQVRVDTAVTQRTKPVSAAGQNEESAKSGERDFSIEDGVLVKYTGKGKDVTVPLGVKKIGRYAFYGNSLLAGVVMPEGVTEIADWAFWCCASLKSVSLPKSLKLIGNGAFYDCRRLETVTVPKETVSIGANAFPKGCKITRR